MLANKSVDVRIGLPVSRKVLVGPDSRRRKGVSNHKAIASVSGLIKKKKSVIKNNSEPIRKKIHAVLSKQPIDD